jgi:hypothetical protein
MSDAAIADLANLEGLSELYVRWTRISDAGAERLRRELPNCKVYSHLLISSAAQAIEPTQ